ncbi:MAG: hypothetical protein KDG44_01670, partial [Burkholderiaceae bacterium]|nr:hypothetical protein [Burkholderiaceae bacterium]
MKSAITQAKIGLSMKKRGMAVRPSAAGGRRCRGLRRRGRRRHPGRTRRRTRGRRLGRRTRRDRLPRHRLYGRIAAQLLEAVDHHHLTGGQAVEHDPLRVDLAADRELARPYLAVRTDDH